MCSGLQAPYRDQGKLIARMISPFSVYSTWFVTLTGVCTVKNTPDSEPVGPDDRRMLRLYRAALLIGVLNVLVLWLFTALFNKP